MTDIFSAEFLHQLREQIRPKTKTSKAVLEAIKDLSIKNEKQKIKIRDLQANIEAIRNQNEMLVEMMETNKQDFEDRIKAKQQKIQKFIHIQAQLSAQNQSLKKQLDNLKAELNMIKQIAQEQLQMPSKTEFSEKSISDKISVNQKGSSCELAAYLFSVKAKTQHSIGEQNKEKQQQYDLKMQSNKLEVSRRSKESETMWKSQQIDSINQSEMQKTVELIMDEDRQSSKI